MHHMGCANGLVQRSLDARTIQRRCVRAAQAVVFTALGLALATASIGCRSAPRSVDQAFLDQRVAEHEARALRLRSTLAQRFLDRLEWRHAELKAEGRNGPVVINALLLSSGGQFGAFGVGVLDGWGKVEQSELARPEFDIVTGVSTGAMIAPFAMSGTDYSIRRITELYMQADDSLAVLRGLLFFLPWRESFFDNRTLRERIAHEMNMDAIAGVAEAHGEHRMLLVGATDLDLGRFHIWDMGHQAERAIETGDPSMFQKAMLSSASIPGAFPPVEIDGTLFADGAAAQATFFGLDREAIGDVVRAFRERNPDAPTPVFRFWMIVNGHLDATPSLVEQRWVSIAARSVAVMLSYAQRTTLRQMQFGAELLERDFGMPVEFRYIAIPAGVDLPESQSRMFDRDLIARLHEVGSELGRDPSSWRTEAISPAIPGSAISLEGGLFGPALAPTPNE